MKTKLTWNGNQFVEGKLGKKIRWWKSRLNTLDIRGGFNTELYERIKAIKNA